MSEETEDVEPQYKIIRVFKEGDKIPIDTVYIGCRKESFNKKLNGGGFTTEYVNVYIYEEYIYDNARNGTSLSKCH